MLWEDRGNDDVSGEETAATSQAEGKKGEKAEHILGVEQFHRFAQYEHITTCACAENAG